ncbi:hypothetical protein P3S67_000446 [Capsicum chacoense]
MPNPSSSLSSPNEPKPISAFPLPFSYPFFDLQHPFQGIKNHPRTTSSTCSPVSLSVILAQNLSLENPASSSSSEIHVVDEKIFEGYLYTKKETQSNILDLSEKMVIQWLTALSEEPLCKIDSPTPPKSIIPLGLYPLDDKMSMDSEDENPLSWKMTKKRVFFTAWFPSNAGKTHESRLSFETLMENALVARKSYTQKRKSMKKKAVIEIELPIKEVNKDVVRSVDSRRANSKGVFVVSPIKHMHKFRLRSGRVDREVGRNDLPYSTKNAEIFTLKFATLKGQEEKNGSNEDLKAGNNMLRAKVKHLEAKVEDLTQQLLNNHAVENERITLLLHQFSNSPSDSST